MHTTDYNIPGALRRNAGLPAVNPEQELEDLIAVTLDLIERLREGKIRGIDTDSFIVILEVRINAYQAEIERLEYIMPAPLVGF